jgi:hypothetical protein
VSRAAAASDENDRLDDRLVFLARAAALFDLVEAGEYTPTEAFEATARVRCNRLPMRQENSRPLRAPRSRTPPTSFSRLEMEKTT